MPASNRESKPSAAKRASSAAGASRLGKRSSGSSRQAASLSRQAAPSRAGKHPTQTKIRSSRPDDGTPRRTRTQMPGIDEAPSSLEARRARWRNEKRRRAQELTRRVADALLEERRPGARRRRPKPRTVIAAVGISVLFIGLFAFFSLLPGWIMGEQRPAPVKLDVSAPGLDCAQGSKIPVIVNGSDNTFANGLHFIDQHGEGLELASGEYTVEVAGSPFAADGALYSFEAGRHPLTVEHRRADTSQVGTLEFVPLPPEETTRELVDDAYRLAAQGGCEEAHAVKLKLEALERIGIDPF